MKKKIFSLLLVFLMAFTLVACKKDKVDPNQALVDEVHEQLGALISNPDDIRNNLTLPGTFINGVTGEWKSSNNDVLEIQKDGTKVTGIVKRPAFEVGNKKVTLSITLTLAVEGKDPLTKEWSKELTVIKLDEIKGLFDSFADSYEEVRAGEHKLTNFRTDAFVYSAVKLYGKTTGGYYLATADGSLAYVHGLATAPDATKVYELTAKIYNYFGYFQLEDVSFKEVDTALELNVEYKASSTQAINNIPLYEKDVLSGAFTPDTLKLTDVKIIIDPTISNAQYNAVIVPKDLDPATAPRKTDGDKHFVDAVMIYYTSTEFAAIKALANLEIDELEVIFEGYRDDKHVKYVTVLGLDNVKLATVSDEEKVAAAKAALEITTDFKAAGTLTLPETGLFETTIDWEYKVTTNENNSLINLETGEVSVKAGERVSVVLTATITSGTETATKDFTIGIGEYPLKTIADALAADVNTIIKVKGIVTNQFDNQTFGLQSGDKAIAIRTTEKLEVGKEYVVTGKKEVSNGLPRLANAVTESPKLASLPAAVNITAILADNEALKAHIGKLVLVKGLEVTKTATDNYGTIIVTAKLGDKTIPVRWDNRVAGTNTTQLSGLAVGDTFDVMTTLGWFNNPQLGFGPSSVIVKEGAATETALLVTYDFASLSGETGKQLNATDLLAVLKSATANKDILVSATDVDRIYQGNGSGGGEAEKRETILKTGTSSATASMRLNFNKNIKKVVITARGWESDESKLDKLTINGVEKSLSNTYETLTFEFDTEASFVNFFFNKRVLIEKIEFFG